MSKTIINFSVSPDFPVNNILDVEQSILLSDYVTICLQWLIFTFVCPAIDIFGLSANIINIICFVKQGFKDPVNISFLGLSLSDTGCVVMLIWCNICYSPPFLTVDHNFDSIELSYLTAGIPHTAFTRATGCITAIIALERCLCIAAPLTVKSIVTSTRVTVIIVCVFIGSLTSIAPVYVVNRIDMKYFPSSNKTRLGLVYTEDRDSVEQVCYIINNVIVPFSSFMVVIICTFILVVQLKKKTKWRNEAMNTTQSDSISNRNKKVAAVVVRISAMFILCFIPMSIVFIAMSLESDFFLDGKYKNLVVVLGGFGIILESINASMNIFVYYYTSSNYRVVFHQLFHVSK